MSRALGKAFSAEIELQSLMFPVKVAESDSAGGGMPWGRQFVLKSSCQAKPRFPKAGDSGQKGHFV